MFKFAKSSHIIAHTEEGTSNEAKEHRRNPSDMSIPSEENVQITPSTQLNDNRKRDRILVCDPDPMLIKKIYLPMKGYISELEEVMKTKQQCSLNVFLDHYVKESFLARSHNQSLQMIIETISKSHDAMRVIITPEEQKTLRLPQPLLQSTVLVYNKMFETTDLINELPDYFDDLLKNVCSLLKSYREICQGAYRAIVYSESEDKRIQSVTWLNDEDISRFLKILPNWMDLKSAKNILKMGQSQKRQTQRPLMTGLSEEESPTQVQYRNIKEADMLTSNLGESEISKSDILSDIGVLKELAILQESMVSS